MFGTFRDKLKEKGSTYRGGAEDRVDEKTAAIHDSKVDTGLSTRLELQTNAREDGRKRLLVPITVLRHLFSLVS